MLDRELPMLPCRRLPINLPGGEQEAESCQDNSACCEAEKTLARLYGDQSTARKRCLQICAQAKKIDEEDLGTEIKVFRAVADVTRLRILKLLAAGELCICEIMLALFAAKVRATRYSTLPELVGSFYGERARAAASALIVFSWIGVIAVQIVASGNVLAAVFGGSAAFYATACAAVFVLYTAHGGQSAVVRTDLVQLAIIVAGIIVLFARSLQAAGPASLVALPGFSFPTSAQMGGWEVASMVIVVGSAYLVGPDMYSRLLSAYGPKEAERAAAISALFLVPLAFLITSLGMLAHLLYPAAQAEQAIPLLMTSLLSPAFQGLVAAALLAAFMSSADTSLMTASSILTLDLYRRARPASTPEHLMATSRFAVLLLGALALALAIFSPGIIKTLMVAYTVFTGGLLVPVVAGFYKDRLGLTPNAALAALAGGGGTAILLGQRYPLLGMATSAALLLGVSWWERKRTYKKGATRGLI